MCDESLWRVPKQFWATRNLWLLPLLLVLCCPILIFIEDSEMEKPTRRCFYVLVVMSLAWVTDALPISATALLPLVLFPPLEIMPAGDTAGVYINGESIIVLGALLVAVAAGEWNLHKRIALLVLFVAGSNPIFLLAGIMLPTWFLSMWMTNCAAASMMMPIAAAILSRIKKIRLAQKRGKDNIAYQPADATEMLEISGDSVKNSNPLSEEQIHLEENHQFGCGVAFEKDLEKEELNDESYNDLCKGLALSVAYAANIGGVSTLTGTPQNLVLRRFADDTFETYQRAAGENPTGSPISFSNWLGFGLPLSVIILVLSWVLLIILYIVGRPALCLLGSKIVSIGKKCRTNSSSISLDGESPSSDRTSKKLLKTSDEERQAIKSVIRQEWKALGSISLAEVTVLIAFVFLAVMWISRDPKESPGWDTWFKSGYVNDSTPAILVALLLFMLPAKIPNIFCRNDPGEPAYTPILTWSTVHKKFPWGILVLLGGGMALAKGVQATHLDDWLGEKLQSLDHLKDWELNLIITIIVAITTEVTSNVATTTLLMPILANLAISLEINPLYLMSSCALVTSFAFMLPVATHSNAIVFSYGHVRAIDMAFAGFFMNVIAVACLNLCVNTWGESIYDFDEFKDIFRANVTNTM